MTGQSVLVICNFEVDNYRLGHQHSLVGLKLCVKLWSSVLMRLSCDRALSISTQPGKVQFPILKTLSWYHHKQLPY